ncbi:MAG: hypothetical protein ACE5LB_17260 [Acidiferrobacterales bacterium]
MEIRTSANEVSSSESAEGMKGYLILQVDIEAGITEYLATIADHVRRALRRVRIGYTGLSVVRDRIVFDVRDPAQSAEAAQLLERSWPEVAVSRADGSFEVFFAGDELARIRSDILHQTLNSVHAHMRARGIDVNGVRAQGQGCILVPPPAADKLKRIMRSHNSGATLTFRLIDTNIDPNQGEVPPGFEVLESQEEMKGQASVRYVVYKRIILSGGHVVDTSVTMANGRSVVIIRFDVLGRRGIREQLPGIERLLAIILNDRVIATARVERLLPDRVIIHGDFAVEQAEHLATVLRAGSYPAPVKIVGACAE